MKVLAQLLQFEQQILAALLLTLHSMTWFIENHWLSYALSFVLYGLFLLWQPLWNKQSNVSRPSFLLPIILLLVFSYFYQNESLIFFSLMITGLIGSRLFNPNTHRAFDLLAIALLIMEMATGIIPRTFVQIELPLQFENYIQVIILVPILLFFFAPVPERGQQTRNQTDLMHGMLTTTLIFLVLLGGIVINILYGVEYLDGLLLTVFIVSTLALGISWFWNPGVGYSGLGVLWNRYAMTIGGPFEVWINTLTTLIEEPYLSSLEFLQAACDHLVEHDWLNGIQWQFETLTIHSGDRKGFEYQHNLTPKIQVTLFFKSDPGQALRQHTVLLIRMAFQFYIARINQEKMQAEAHFQTIHHTGARLTHDMKNILQSIKASLDILEVKPAHDQDVPTRLLSQNLKQISARLESTLTKLKAPELSQQPPLVGIETWVDSFIHSHRSERLSIRREIDQPLEIPVELFDSVITNLVNNALEKTELTQVIVDVSSKTEMIVITVCDDGQAVAEEVENQLFKHPVSSGNGMGIGLYQSSIMARSYNFELELANNESGKVCFSLFQHFRD